MPGAALPAGTVSPRAITEGEGCSGRRATSTSPKMPLGSTGGCRTLGDSVAAFRFAGSRSACRLPEIDVPDKADVDTGSSKNRLALPNAGAPREPEVERDNRSRGRRGQIDRPHARTQETRRS